MEKTNKIKLIKVLVSASLLISAGTVFAATGATSSFKNDLMGKANTGDGACDEIITYINEWAVADAPSGGGSKCNDKVTDSAFRSCMISNLNAHKTETMSKNESGCNCYTRAVQEIDYLAKTQTEARRQYAALQGFNEPPGMYDDPTSPEAIEAAQRRAESMGLGDPTKVFGDDPFGMGIKGLSKNMGLNSECTKTVLAMAEKMKGQTPEKDPASYDPFGGSYMGGGTPSSGGATPGINGGSSGGLGGLLSSATGAAGNAVSGALTSLGVPANLASKITGGLKALVGNSGLVDLNPTTALTAGANGLITQGCSKLKDVDPKSVMEGLTQATGISPYRANPSQPTNQYRVPVTTMPTNNSNLAPKKTNKTLLDLIK